MIGRIALIGIVVGMVLGIAHTGAIQQRATLTPEGQQLLDYAAKFSGYTVPKGVVPRVVYLTDRQIAGLVCGAPDAECAVEGVYFGGPNVYVQAGLEDAHRRSVIVHEFVHWLQRQSGRFSAERTCLSQQLEEREAYAAQNKYLKEVEHSTDFSYPPVAVCGKR